MDVLEVNAATQEAFAREFTEQELAQREVDRVTFEQAQAEATAKREADRVAREAAIAHAKSLGFTDEMIAVMYPNLGAQ